MCEQKLSQNAVYQLLTPLLCRSRRVDQRATPLSLSPFLIPPRRIHEKEKVKTALSLNRIMFEREEFDNTYRVTRRQTRDGKRYLDILLEVSDHRAQHCARVLRTKSGDTLRMGVVNCGARDDATAEWVQRVSPIVEGDHSQNTSLGVQVQRRGFEERGEGKEELEGKQYRPLDRWCPAATHLRLSMREERDGEGIGLSPCVSEGTEGGVGADGDLTVCAASREENLDMHLKEGFRRRLQGLWQRAKTIVGLPLRLAEGTANKDERGEKAEEDCGGTPCPSFASPAATKRLLIYPMTTLETQLSWPLLSELPSSLRPKVDLLLCLPRVSSLKRIIPAVASLQVDRLFLCGGSRVEPQYWSSRVMRDEGNLERMLVEGCAQSGIVQKPQLLIRQNLRKFLTEELDGLVPRDSAIRIAAHPSRLGPLDWRGSVSSFSEAAALSSLSSALLDEKPQTVEKLGQGTRPQRVILAIGPEGGWDEPSELDLLSSVGFVGLSLGASTLRTSTALPVLLALAHQWVQTSIETKKSY
uniref:16S rRNA (uracil(1498)-N(3))-methyltransferase n=1 Tax=Chromera velia CCMP2878 TaxID=1169474 RepID=A0A0G4F549_9ALVE|eukprot:Cvel_15124.t1-p1 / transcript=Cvel_15124.t1 / gene=Cvel_15124 / organism=Chromera_velia_CCMP2878 / gene_product=hypothetical protein / transcript_product=hypothetical protein / location=Cvel_scaffold1104:7517-10984(+) / protein_length=527 / sequence_SO=supercontig / SO=protein_coding / is_pseudo=false